MPPWILTCVTNFILYHKKYIHNICITSTKKTAVCNAYEASDNDRIWCIYKRHNKLGHASCLVGIKHRDQCVYSL